MPTAMLKLSATHHHRVGELDRCGMSLHQDRLALHNRHLNRPTTLPSGRIRGIRAPVTGISGITCWPLHPRRDDLGRTNGGGTAFIGILLVAIALVFGIARANAITRAIPANLNLFAYLILKVAS